MKHIYDEFAYSDAPRANCWWDETCEAVERPALDRDETCDVAIIGGGFTGLSAALHLAQAGVKVLVLESRYVGWGASGRNGGFCCLGGGRLSDQALDRKFGRDSRLAFRRAELAAINLVDTLTKEHNIEIDRHSDGETELAHRAKDMTALRARVPEIKENYGLEATLIEKRELADHGLRGDFHGGLTIPAGFALNPRKYVTGLAAAAGQAGAVIYHETTAQNIVKTSSGYQVQTKSGSVKAKNLLIATNGYSSEDLPDWMAGRYMPAQSSVIVTRPLTDEEIKAAGWFSNQMVYDSRYLLHYFRLMPDRRMLFGMRGGLMTGPSAEKYAIANVRRDFEQFFPAWRHVETPHSWSGMVCLSREHMPFVGEVPDNKGMFASLCYHGNGVAMGTYCGALAAHTILGETDKLPFPIAIKTPLTRFELGGFRRALLPFAYLWYGLADR
ncbi:FAD-binding oxidoreductase [Sulfitobacter sp. CW3]|uniref:NAD(P)/FAD-dependent oxidoreductase n=1 Tax=Sulfitobacter sp. CW3 TaxID=2861965 RepID=UPI001C5E43B4|nr:FAD-binding oxidoreductase [Sulfitobacter sp. CW3]MBW4962646.1 FAD-binding oxidoreductase [Sulfitobacter sp. CW3]